MERMTTGTRQGHDSTQASASLFQANKKMAPPNGFLTSGSHAIVNVVNTRELHNERLTPGTQQLAQLFLFWVNLINATPNLVYPRNATAISKL